jgi:hypothetical protein
MHEEKDEKNRRSKQKRIPRKKEGEMWKGNATYSSVIHHRQKPIEYNT